MREIDNTDEMRDLRKHLAHLRALRAFEAVAHHKSFTAAARELAVSQGAVSHQIRLLEEYLGLRLFARSRSGAVPTREAELLRDVCSRSFDEMGRALALLNQSRTVRMLRVRSGPYFAMKVIAPRISEFLGANPGVQLYLNNLEPDSASMGSEDVSIKYCTQPPPNMTAAEIFREHLVPIGSPNLLADGVTSADVLGDTGIARLHYRDLSDWQEWSRRFAKNQAIQSQDLIFDDQHIILEAVRSGQGIGIADRSLIQDDIARGRVVILSEQSFQPDAAYRFIYKAERAASNPAIELFKTWLEGEVHRLQHRPPGKPG